MRIPTATYRLQFSPTFGFNDARRALSYLSELGVSDIYASPIFKAREGSEHGYDIVDPKKLNLQPGSGDDFRALITDVKSMEMGWLQDIVPNHMAFDRQNHMLMDVLENGESSAYFNYFDIEWEHASEDLKGRVLAPFLGRFYGECLEDGEIKLSYDKQGFSVNYYEHRFPLRMSTYDRVLTHNLDTLRRDMGRDNPDFIKLLGVLYVIKSLSGPPANEERADQVLFIKKMLWDLYERNRQIRDFFDDNLEDFNGVPGSPDSFNLLDELLWNQLFRLSFWKVATEEINYKRFFSINELISLRMQDDEVFDDTHSLIFELINEKAITGLRIDHIDGLYDPTRHLNKLSLRAGDIFVIAEKILGYDEKIPTIWPIQGTTGYDFLNRINLLFSRAENESEFESLYSEFVGDHQGYEELLYSKRKLIIEQHMAGDLDNLAHVLHGISRKIRYGFDITLYGLKRALVEILALFPVYRTYADGEKYREEGAKRIREALEGARRRYPGLSYEFNFIERVLFFDMPDNIPEEERAEWLHFIMKFQQLTAPLAAKGYEDTVLYIYNRFISHNEVGSDLATFGMSAKDFHEFNRERAAHRPHSLNATSTHDAKRGEDVRARLSVLSEIPRLWADNVRKWKEINRDKITCRNGEKIPDPNDEYFFYQTLVGAYPFKDDDSDEFMERMKGYVIKAVREAKIYTAWIKPDEEYERTFLGFVEGVLESKEFMGEFLPFQKTLAHYGVFNSLSQTLLKITCPGIPDIYRGCELWELSLVDPDNRRPVDFDKRTRYLETIKSAEETRLNGLIEEMLSDYTDGRLKLFTIYRALNARKNFRELFDHGEYVPLRARGACADRVVAFARHMEGRWAIIAVPRFLTELIEPGQAPLGEDVWQDTAVALPERAPARCVHVFTDEVCDGDGEIKISDVFSRFPAGFLVGESK